MCVGESKASSTDGEVCLVESVGWEFFVFLTRFLLNFNVVPLGGQSADSLPEIVDAPVMWSGESCDIFHLPNSVTYLKSFIFSDVLQLAIIMLFILKHFLVPDNVILAELAALGNHLSFVSNQK